MGLDVVVAGVAELLSVDVEHSGGPWSQLKPITASALTPTATACCERPGEVRQPKQRAPDLVAQLGADRTCHLVDSAPVRDHESRIGNREQRLRDIRGGSSQLGPPLGQTRHGIAVLSRIHRHAGRIEQAPPISHLEDGLATDQHIRPGTSSRLVIGHDPSPNRCLR
jgi:hypothetical protein